MPADYQSAAHSLAVSPTRSRSSPSPPPPWAMPPQNGTGNGHGGRLSMTRMRTMSSLGDGNGGPMHQRVWRLLKLYNDLAMRTLNRLTPLQKALAVAATVGIYAAIIFFAIYHAAIFDWLTGVATSWRAMPGGWLVVFALIFVSSFPPMIGYSTFVTIAGFVYGFPHGWFIALGAVPLGSFCAFIASRTVLSSWVDRMVGRDARFRALGQVLRRDGIWYLTGIRFCPLPYSLSNGFLATIPSITPTSFTLATALSTPKLLVHVFIGSRLAELAENGDKMSFGDRVVNYLSMFIGGVVGTVVGWLIYKRTMARAAEIALEEATEEGQVDRSTYLDREDTLMDPEDAAALMSDDDLSLWETQIDESAEQQTGIVDVDDESQSKAGHGTNGHLAPHNGK